MVPVNKVAGCVVLYHPNSTLLSNINSYYNSVRDLIVVDNSPTSNTSLLNDLYNLFPNAVYLFLNRNAGIAAALNIGCKIAIEQGYGWLLTMDQDSSFKDDQLSKMINSVPIITSKFPDVGIITPHHVLHNQHVPTASTKYTVRNIAMTSGNLLNLSAYKKCGPFNEKLFMDFVDYEYCLRLRKNNYKIIQDNSIHLNHTLGNYKIKKFFNRKIGVSNHNSLRRYYMTRNSLYVAFKYFSEDKKFFILALWNLVIWNPFIILSFERSKLSKLKSIYKGVYHFVINKYGKAVE
jgi:rhamnosyltransferase